MTTENFAFFVGRELQQISLGKYQVIFRFDGDVSVSVESSIEWRHGSTVVRWRIEKEDIPENAAWLRILGRRISGIFWINNQDLKLVLENGDELIFFKGSDGYESFQITKNGRVWVS